MATFTPESTDGGEEEEEDADGGLPADPLLSGAAAAGQRGGLGGEVYELREGVGRRRRTPGGRAMSGEEEEALYYDDDEDDLMMSAEEYEEEDLVFTADEEMAVVRKFDRRLVLFVALLYLLSFLDRSSESRAPIVLHLPFSVILRRLLSLLLASVSR